MTTETNGESSNNFESTKTNWNWLRYSTTLEIDDGVFVFNCLRIQLDLSSARTISFRLSRKLTEFGWATMSTISAKCFKLCYFSLVIARTEHFCECFGVEMSMWTGRMNQFTFETCEMYFSYWTHCLRMLPNRILIIYLINLTSTRWAVELWSLKTRRSAIYTFYRILIFQNDVVLFAHSATSQSSIFQPFNTLALSSLCSRSFQLFVLHIRKQMQCHPHTIRR